MNSHSIYYDKKEMNKNAYNNHRGIIGGKWEEIGKLQFDFLIRNGLNKNHKLLDIGCGSLRGGVHFIDYLDSPNYYGTDINNSLIEVGREKELSELLKVKAPPENFHVSPDFQFKKFNTKFDYAIAQSLFTHLPFNHIRLCLSKLSPQMKINGKFFATFFIAPTKLGYEEKMVHEKGGVTTYSFKDPYHYYLRDLKNAVKGLPWKLKYVKDWEHPRDQQIALFLKV